MHGARAYHRLCFDCFVDCYSLPCCHVQGEYLYMVREPVIDPSRRHVLVRKRVGHVNMQSGFADWRVQRVDGAAPNQVRLESVRFRHQVDVSECVHACVCMCVNECM